MTGMLSALPKFHRPKWIDFRDHEPSAPRISTECLTPRQTCMLQAIVSGKTPTGAAEMTGVPRSAVYQPRIPFDIDNTQRENCAAIRQQYEDRNAPHLFVGRKAQGVTDRDAKQLPPPAPTTEGVTDRDANSIERPKEMYAIPRSVTDRDANSIETPKEVYAILRSVTHRDAESALPRQILTESNSRLAETALNEIVAMEWNVYKDAPPLYRDGS